jgi:hypothetical protein
MKRPHLVVAWHQESTHGQVPAQAASSSAVTASTTCTQRPPQAQINPDGVKNGDTTATNQSSARQQNWLRVSVL